MHVHEHIYTTHTNTNTRKENGERVTSQKSSRIKFEPRGLDSRQLFGGWSEALECHLTALTPATSISPPPPPPSLTPRRSYWSSRRGHRFLHPATTSFAFSPPAFLLAGQASRAISIEPSHRCVVFTAGCTYTDGFVHTHKHTHTHVGDESTWTNTLRRNERTVRARLFSLEERKAWRHRLGIGASRHPEPCATGKVDERAPPTYTCIYVYVRPFPLFYRISF